MTLRALRADSVFKPFHLLAFVELGATRNFNLHFFAFELPPMSTRFPYTTLFRSGDWLRPSTGTTLSGSAPDASSCDTFATSPDRKSTRLNSSHLGISYAVFCLKKKKRTL